ncbi:MAG: phosphotransferase [Oscillospiraceae bacterium]|nr:phosphotransferase [Oscillospiraceae bacterium]
MNLTPITSDISLYHVKFHPLLSDAKLYDSSCSTQAKVIFIDKDGGYFLKSSPKGTLMREAALTRYFHDSFGYASSEEAWAVVEKYAHFLKTDTLLHGDYCLPNIILNDWKFSGFIDLDSGGVGDRHVDVFWGAFTLWFNLKTDKYRERFLDAYGRDKVDKEMLRVVAAVEVFGWN